MAKDIPYKKLNPRDAQALAKSIARADSKRVSEVLDRVGGIDGSAIRLALTPDWDFKTLMSQRENAGGALRRVLARCPDEVFDEIAGGMALTEWSFLFTKSAKYGIAKEPKAVEKLCAACARGSEQANELLAVYADRLANMWESHAGKKQEQALSLAAGKTGAILASHFESLGADMLDRFLARSSGEDMELVKWARANIEKKELSQEMEAAPVEEPQSNRRKAL